VGTGFSSENASLDELDYFPSRWAIPSGLKMDRARFPSLRMAFGTTRIAWAQSAPATFSRNFSGKGLMIDVIASQHENAWSIEWGQ
jgi:hypothetical protein